MIYEQLVATVMRRTGIEDEKGGRRVLAETLGALGRRLRGPAREALAGCLPPEAAGPLRKAAPVAKAAGGPADEVDLEGVYKVLAKREKVSVGFALEHTHAVCQAIAERLVPAERDELRASLPGALAALFVAREPYTPPAHLHGANDRNQKAPRRHTLSEGVPGSSHPLSESPFDGAHSGSVIASPNPHAHTKVSSARGHRQETYGETLATGHPRPVHSLEEGAEPGGE